MIAQATTTEKTRLLFTVELGGKHTRILDDCAASLQSLARATRGLSRRIITRSLVVRLALERLQNDLDASAPNILSVGAGKLQ